MRTWADRGTDTYQVESNRVKIAEHGRDRSVTLPLKVRFDEDAMKTQQSEWAQDKIRLLEIRQDEIRRQQHQFQSCVVYAILFFLFAFGLRDLIYNTAAATNII